MQSTHAPHAPPAASALSTSEARSAFEALEPEVLAVDLTEIQVPRIDVQRSAAVAHSIAVRDQSPSRLALFQRLASAKLYPDDGPQRLARLSLAAWFARQQQLRYRALATEASVPEPVLREAQQHRNRMVRVLEYWLDDDPELMAEVATLRQNSGYQRLANDLERLADIHARSTVHAQIQHDTKHVHSDDVERARSLARSIFSGLGLGVEKDHQRWSDLCQRTWTLLLREYEEHRAAGAFLLRSVEDVEETYPSLIAMSRSTRPRRTPDAEDAPSSDEPPEAETIAA